MLKKRFASAFLAFASPFCLWGQADNEIQVYASPTIGKKRTIVELHSNHTFRGPRLPHSLYSTAWTNETLEITTGIGSHAEIGFYTFTAFAPDGSYHYQGNQIRPRITAPESWKLPFGLSLSAEFGFFRPHRDSSFTWQGELRPIMDISSGNWYFSLNPNMDFVVSGPEKQVGLAPQFKSVYTFGGAVGLGVEYYTYLGKANRLLPLVEQEHLLGPALDLYLHPDWEINAAFLFGLTDYSHQRIFKLLLGRRFGK